MYRRTAFLILVLSIALPIAAHADGVLLIVVDVKQNRAYVPEGTILPPGLQIRAERADVGRALRQRAPKLERISAPPLVFEYAPAERFVEARQQYEAQRASHSSRFKANEDRACAPDYYVTVTNSGIYGTYTKGLTGHFCSPTTTVPGQSYLWEFTAYGDYSDVDFRINPYVAISDTNGNFSCYAEYYSPGTQSCYASAVTPKTGNFCENNVTLSSLVYVIEYTNDPYHDNYVGFNLQITYCTDFR